MVRMRRYSRLLLLLLLLLAGVSLSSFIITTRLLLASAIVPTDRVPQPVTNGGMRTVLVTVPSGAEEPFDLGPDPFDDTLRREALRNLTRARLRLGSAGAPSGFDPATFDPATGTVIMLRGNMTQYYEVRRRTVREHNRAANETELEATLRLLKMEMEKELDQLPADQPPPPPVFLVSTWRSGSTFLGHVLSAQPGVFTHYEPLAALGVHQARSEQQLRTSRHTIDELLACRYTDIPDYMNVTRRNTEDMLSHNPRVWNACIRGPNRNACVNEKFLGAACRLLPLHVFKLVRLRLRELEPQMRMGARVLYLVRDPRDTVSSRLRSVRWCRRSAECVQPARLCADLMDDMEALHELHSRYPASVRLVEYEQLATQPQRQLRSIFRFIGFRWTREVEQLVSESTQTRKESSEPWAVRKNSAQHVGTWRQRLTPKQVAHINHKCASVLQQLGHDRW